MMAWRRLSSGVARRFPTYGHFIAAGLLTERELGQLEALSAQTEEGNRQISWAPIMWAQAAVRRAREDKLIIDFKFFDTLTT